MIDILKSDLEIKYKNFWYDIGVKLQKQIKGIVQILVLGNEVFVKIFIEKFNYQTVYSYDYRLNDNDILQHILNGLQYNIYKEVFKN